MSIFQTTEENSQAKSPEAEPKTSWLDKLVETRGEQWRDPEVIAKGKLESDAYIKNLEKQAEELRKELEKQDYAKSLLEQLQNKAAHTNSANTGVSNNNVGAETSQTKAALSEDDLRSLVEKTLSQKERDNTAKQNLSLVESKLTEEFGAEAQSHVISKAKELGMSLERMEEIAKESPSAFLALIGTKSPEPRVFNQGSIRTEGVGMKPSSTRDFNFYQELRKKDRKQYYSPGVQKQMFADRERLGDKFYG